jgi:hypothetical protein
MKVKRQKAKVKTPVLREEGGRSTSFAFSVLSAGFARNATHAPQPVIPAKAGIQAEWRGQAWIPAFAGMTQEQNLPRHARIFGHGNSAGSVFRFS